MVVLCRLLVATTSGAKECSFSDTHGFFHPSSRFVSASVSCVSAHPSPRSCAILRWFLVSLLPSVDVEGASSDTPLPPPSPPTPPLCPAHLRTFFPDGRARSRPSSLRRRPVATAATSLPLVQPNTRTRLEQTWQVGVVKRRENTSSGVKPEKKTRGRMRSKIDEVRHTARGAWSSAFPCNSVAKRCAARGTDEGGSVRACGRALRSSSGETMDTALSRVVTRGKRIAEPRTSCPRFARFDFVRTVPSWGLAFVAPRSDAHLTHRDHIDAIVPRRTVSGAIEPRQPRPRRAWTHLSQGLPSSASFSRCMRFVPWCHAPSTTTTHVLVAFHLDVLGRRSRSEGEIRGGRASTSDPDESSTHHARTSPKQRTIVPLNLLSIELVPRRCPSSAVLAPFGEVRRGFYGRKWR